MAGRRRATPPGYKQTATGRELVPAKAGKRPSIGLAVGKGMDDKARSEGRQLDF